MITSNKMDKALNFPFPLTASSKLENRSASKQQICICKCKNDGFIIYKDFTKVNKDKIIFQFYKFYMKNSINDIILYSASFQNILSIICTYNYIYYHLSSCSEEGNTDTSRSEITTLKLPDNLEVIIYQSNYQM